MMKDISDERKHELYQRSIRCLWHASYIGGWSLLSWLFSFCYAETMGNVSGTCFGYTILLLIPAVWVGYCLSSGAKSRYARAVIMASALLWVPLAYEIIIALGVKNTGYDSYLHINPLIAGYVVNALFISVLYAHVESTRRERQRQKALNNLERIKARRSSFHQMFYPRKLGSILLRIVICIVSSIILIILLLFAWMHRW